MGDRCYLRIAVKNNRASAIAEELGAVRDDDDGQAVWLMVEEANYGLATEREALAEGGEVFLGWHAEGGEYGPYRFASDGQHYLECPADHDGSLFAAIGEDGQLDAAMLDRARRLLLLEAQVTRFLEMETRGVVPDTTGEPAHILQL